MQLCSEVQLYLQVNNISPGEWVIIQQVLEVLLLDVQLIYSLQQ